jgi:hypothetical protein
MGNLNFGAVRTSPLRPARVLYPPLGGHIVLTSKNDLGAENPIGGCMPKFLAF